MIYRALTPTGDYTFGFGRTSFLSGSAAIAQAIRTKLSLFQGDFWENLDDGLPFFQSIAGSGDKSLIDLLFQSRILQTPGVSSIASFESSFESNRRYTMTVSVLTTANDTVEVTI